VSAPRPAAPPGGPTPSGGQTPPSGPVPPGRATAPGSHTEPPKGTGVGSYFVANYPPFSFWRPENLPEARETLARPGDPAVPLGLYLHIPFCRLRCKFCYFRVYTDKNAREIEDYLEALAREVELYRDQPALAGRPLSFIYFGGGTPSYPSTGQLRALVARLKAALPWDRAQEVSFECEPGTLTSKKLQTIREIGATRLSLGIENFDDRILEENGRAHRSAEIYRAFGEAREMGFPQINIDLIAGMVGETEANWRDCVRRAAELAPESITIYQMELPFNTEFSRQILSSKSGPRVAGWEEKRAWVEYGFAELERAGYRVSSGYTLVKEDGPAGAASPFVYRDSLWRGGDMIGTGVASFSYLGGVHYQNVDRFEDYLERLHAGELPLWRALQARPVDRLVREMILQLKLGEIDASYFRAKFRVEILSRFSDPFQGLKEEGLLDWRGDRITLSRQGLLRVDELLHRFFLPEHQGARYT
jgi:oxygen-independent coproporphyrinogen-3 oxidase